MRMSGEISNALGILTKTDLDVQNSLIISAKLSIRFPHLANTSQIINLLKRDKISVNGKIALVVLKKIGRHEVINDVDEAIVRSTLDRFLF